MYIYIYIYKSNSSNIWSYNHSHTNTYLELKWPLFWYFWLEKALFWEVSLPNIEGIGGSDGDGGVSRSQTSPSCCSVDHPQHVDPLDLGVSSAKPSDPTHPVAHPSTTGGTTTGGSPWWSFLSPKDPVVFWPPSKFDVFMYGLGWS